MHRNRVGFAPLYNIISYPAKKQTLHAIVCDPKLWQFSRCYFTLSHSEGFRTLFQYIADGRRYAMTNMNTRRIDLCSPERSHL